ncbi:allantoate deiminase [Alkalihalobacillus xiaoxiensis]|uniref:Allantoate deiminase n=1 Tax=Shouchella xiaoxiensis TaxID=766895 RepID=A0ABS2SQM7_9BACI|nr:Zn-dependent hydrolase [Shouchella xiaoxiensis]MBM7837801.1 allantoate deiminase [Shouchella xiaoxiensis]
MTNNQQTLSAITTLIEQMAQIGKTSDGGVTRLLYTSDWFKAQQEISDLFQTHQLKTFFDDSGNVYGRAEGKAAAEPVILTGSHIDTVINGGKYDGTYGVLASLLAVSELLEEHGQPQKTIDVVSFCEEEGSRFPLNFWGSGSVTGIHTGKDYSDVLAADGTAFTEAKAQYGFGQGDYLPAERTDIGAFVELHIEQGAILADAGESLGIVKGIVGQKRFIFTVTGESNHAGTTPMHKRRDAMAVATELIHKLIETGRKTDVSFVATVGQMMVEPNTPNVIPGKVTFTLDVRHPSKEALVTYHSKINGFVDQLRTADVDIAVNHYSDVAPVAMSEKLAARAYEHAQAKGLKSRYMYSGAGHDAQILGSVVPTCLLFVPSKNGISHSPHEYTKPEDLQIGVDALKQVIYELAYT